MILSKSSTLAALISLALLTTLGNQLYAAPTIVSLTPTSGTGLTQTFTLTVSNPNGATNISTMYVIVGPISTTNDCFIGINGQSENMGLWSDSGVELSNMTIGSSSSESNSQCTLYASGSSISEAGTTLTLNLNVAFTTAYAGTHDVYAYAVDVVSGTSVGYQLTGTWTVPSASNQPPTIISVTPTSGTGLSQTFTATISNPNGAANISTMYLIIGPISTTNDCFIGVNGQGNTIGLWSDSGGGPIFFAIGSSTSESNSQCTLYGAGSSISKVGNTLTFSLNIAFTAAAYAGTHDVYAYAVDAVSGLSVGYQFTGTWTVPPSNYLDLQQFTDCIGPNIGNYGYICQLDARPGNPYQISSTLTVTRSNIYVTGTIYTSLEDTILSRASGSSFYKLMEVGPGVQSVTIGNLTFDGNRGGTGLNCIVETKALDDAGLGNETELDLSAGSFNTIYNTQFLDSPFISLNPGYGTIVESSAFFRARIYAVYVFPFQGSNNLSWNMFEQVGVNAVNVGPNTYLLSNQFWSNQDEFAYGSGGGQVLISNVSGVTLSNNVIDGNHVLGTVGQAAGPYSCTIPGSNTGTVLRNVGIEAGYGGGNFSFYNTWVTNQTGDGIGFYSAQIGSVLLSNYDPNFPTLNPANIVSNDLTGIGIHNKPENPITTASYTTASFTFDGIASLNNGGTVPGSGEPGYGSGIVVDGNPSINGNPGPTVSVQFNHNACLSGNREGRIQTGATPYHVGGPVNVMGLPGSDTCPPR